MNENTHMCAYVYVYMYEHTCVYIFVCVNLQWVCIQDERQSHDLISSNETSCDFMVRKGSFYLEEGYAVFVEYAWTDHGHFVSQKGGTVARQAGKKTLGQPFQPFSMLGRNNVPRFGLAKV